VVVDANVWYWTPEGMRENPSTRGGKTGYIEARQVERLLEEAHARGVRQGRDQICNENAHLILAR
jgi:hypothetical protein